MNIKDNGRLDWSWGRPTGSPSYHPSKRQGLEIVTV